jgi:hypothetical protein
MARGIGHADVYVVGAQRVAVTAQAAGIATATLLPFGGSSITNVTGRGLLNGVGGGLYGGSAQVAGIATISGVGTFTGGGGGGAPSAPTIVAVRPDVTSAIIWVKSPSSVGNGITKYTAVSSPGGLTGTSVFNANANGTSGRMVVGGLNPATSYTFQVYATNSSGDGALSAASSAINPLAYTDFWFYHGYSFGLQNSRPCTIYSSGVGTIDNPTVPVAGGPQTVPAGTTCVRIVDSGGFNWGPSVFHGMNPDGTFDGLNNGNGRISMKPYRYLTFKVWASAAGWDGVVDMWIERFYNGVATGGTANTLVDATTNWTTNYWTSNNGALWNLSGTKTNGSPWVQAVTANTGNTITAAGVNASAGQLYEVGISDVLIGNLLNPIDTYITSPVAHTFSLGVWNTFNFPLTDFDNVGAGQIVSQEDILKYAFGPLGGVGARTYYMTDIGFTFNPA